MTNRISKKSQSFGLIAWLEQTRVQLPLKAVECRFSVCGELLNVEIDQVFHQNNPHALDCLYTFPLPGKAAVYKCEMHVNGRLIEARVEAQEEARRIVTEKKAAGFRTGLVEMERDNLFTLSLGNLQPEDMVVVRLAYFQTLTRLKDWTSFNIPFCPGVRYIPGAPLLRSNSGKGVVDDTDQVPDASRITPPRIDRFHRDAACLHVEGVIENPGEDLADLSSPSHPLIVREQSGAITISIAEGSSVPDCDVIVRWTDRAHANLRPVGWRTRVQGESFALARIKAPGNAEVNEAYEQDVYFLIDRSGSMGGTKWEKAVHAFLAFLRVLGKGDRAWATFFESGFKDIAEKPLSPEALLQDKAVLKIGRLGVAGGTELLPALEHVLEKVDQFSASRPASLLIITDGQVGNEQAVVELLGKHPTLRVHTFGIDTAVNDAFLQQVAAQQHGQSCLLSPNDDIAGAVSRLGDRLRRPVLTSIRLLGDWETPGRGIPDLCADEVLNLPLKGKQGTSQVVFEGKCANGQTQQFKFDLLEVNSPALEKLWAKQRIDHLLAAGDSQSAISLAKQHNLVCRGAAFVAWDEHEKVAVASPERKIYQPSMQTRSVAAGASLASLSFCEDTDLMHLELNCSFASDVRRLRKSKLARFFGLKEESKDPGVDAKDGTLGAKAMSQSLIGLLSKEPGGEVANGDRAKKLEWLGIWCETMFEISWLSSTGGSALLETVCRWALENASQWQACQESLMMLVLQMQGGGDDRERLRGWLQSTLTGKWQTEALAKWERLEELPANKKP